MEGGDALRDAASSGEPGAFWLWQTCITVVDQVENPSFTNAKIARLVPIRARLTAIATRHVPVPLHVVRLACSAASRPVVASASFTPDPTNSGATTLDQ